MFEGQLSRTTSTHADELAAVMGCWAYSDRKRSEGVAAYRLMTKAAWLEEFSIHVSCWLFYYGDWKTWLTVLKDLKELISIKAKYCLFFPPAPPFLTRFHNIWVVSVRPQANNAWVPLWTGWILMVFGPEPQIDHSVTKQWKWVCRRKSASVFISESWSGTHVPVNPLGV